MNGFLYSHECVYKKGHYGDMNFVTWEDEDGDPGGVTKYGIDAAAHRGVDIKNLTKEKADTIYWAEFLRDGVDKYPDPLCWAIFNCNINCGSGRTKAILAKGIKDADTFLKEQNNFYLRLIDQRPKFAKFKKGWLARTADLRAFLKI